MGLTNNDIFKKLRVAHKLTNDDIVEICALADFRVSASELGAIFRREGHPKYMECGDQILRNFLDGLIIYKRGPKSESKKSEAKKKPYKKKTHSSSKDNPKHKHKRQNTQKPGSSTKSKGGKFNKPNS